MLKLAGLVFLLWIVATFVAAWIGNLLSGVASLIGPYVRVKRDTNPFGYTLAMALLFIPVAVGITVAAASFKMAFPYQRIPTPPAKGYSQPSGSASQPAGYFPAALTSATYKCADIPKEIPLLRSTEATWYSQQLAAAGEPSLLPAPTSDRSVRNVYRFMWLRSFNKPIMVRIQESAGGAFLMTASRLSGRGGDKPGKVEARVERALTKFEISRFHWAYSGAYRLKLQAVSCRHGYDGARWIFEAADAGAYRYVNRWSPTIGPVWALGLVMLSFTGWVTDPS